MKSYIKEKHKQHYITTQLCFAFLAFFKKMWKIKSDSSGTSDQSMSSPQTLLELHILNIAAQHVRAHAH